MLKEKSMFRILFSALTLGTLIFAFSWYFFKQETLPLKSRVEINIEVLQNRATTPDAKLELAQNYYQKFIETSVSSNLDAALSILNNVDANDSRYKNHLLALIYLEKHDYQLTLKFSDQLLQQEPNYQQAQYPRGLALMHLNRYDEAIKALESFAIVEPELADTYEMLSDLYSKTGQPEKSKLNSSKAAKLLGKS